VNNAFLTPDSLEEALEALADGEAVPIAGGVVLALLSNLGMFSADQLVSLAGLPELRGVRIEDDMVTIGAASTHAQLAADPVLQSELPVAAAMFGHIGNVRVRAWGTVGGNLAFAEPSQDPPVLLHALGGAVTVDGPQGPRRVPISELFDAPMSTVLEPGELIVSVILPRSGPNERSAYAKFIPRTADDYATVSAAVNLRFEGSTVSQAKIVCGSVGPVPMECAQAAELMIGQRLEDRDVLKAVADSVCAAVEPMNDHRGSADYKREMSGVFTRRALLQCQGGRDPGKEAS
jgi:aerobic carbon-monoxide dehydrogenase medium subunit